MHIVGCHVDLPFAARGPKQELQLNGCFYTGPMPEMLLVSSVLVPSIYFLVTGTNGLRLY